MPSVRTLIEGYNNGVLIINSDEDTENNRKCNCPRNAPFLLDGECLAKGMFTKRPCHVITGRQKHT